MSLLQFLNNGYFAGKVGIGTESPDSLLHIYNPSTSWDEEAVITLGTDIEGTTQAQLRYYRGLTNATTEAFQIIIGSTTALTVLGTSGNVGIGTETPVSTWLTGFDPSTGNGTFKLTSEGWIVTPFLTGLAGYYPGQGARPIIWADGTGTNIQSWDSDATDGVTIRSSDGARRLFVKENGNVGIGNVSPESLLHIKGADPILLIQDDSTGTAQASSTLRLGESGAAGVLDIYWDIKQAADDLNTHLEINHSSNGNALTILDNKNVGIGATSPNSKLQVGVGTSNQQSDVTSIGTSVNGLASVLSLVNQGGNETDGNGVSIDFHNAANWSATGRISVIHPTATTGTSTDSSMQFSTYGTVGSTTTFEPRMTIDYQGNVGIGTNSPDAKLEVKTPSYNAANAVANFVNGNDPVRVSYDTVVIAQTDVPCLHLVETVDGSQANEQKLSFSVGDGKAIIRSSATAINGLYINVAGTNDAPGYQTVGLNAIRVLNTGNSIFNYNVGIGITTLAAKLHVAGNAIIGDLSAERSTKGLTVGYSDSSAFSANTDISDTDRTISLINEQDDTLNTFTAIGFRVSPDTTTSMGDLKFVRTAANENSLIWTAKHGTGFYDRFTIKSDGDVGIGTTSPQSKLQVAGGIQIADDTATASATKVGTMRYRTGTEYVEVTGTELITNGDFATDTDWIKQSNWTISGGLANSDGNSGYIKQNSVVTNNKTYKVSFTATVSGGRFRAVTTADGSTYTPYITSSGYYVFTMSPTVSVAGGFEFISDSFTGSVDNVSVMEVTAEDASYADMCMQTGASTYEWVNIVRNTY